jgi:serine/threonine-protein kinase RsbW
MGNRFSMDQAGVLEFELSAVEESVPTARERVAGWIAQLGASDAHVYGIKTALTEAVANAVLHAYCGRPDPSGFIRVRARACDSNVTLSVEDAGKGMAPRHDSPGLGVGLPLMARLADDIEIICMPPRQAGTEVRMIFDLGGGGAARHLAA